MYVFSHNFLKGVPNTAECSAFQFQQTGPRNCALIVLEQDAERYGRRIYPYLQKR